MTGPEGPGGSGMRPRVRVATSELKVAHSPVVLVSYGLGSCLGIALYDPEARLGALAHALLPTSPPGAGEGRPARFVESAVRLMHRELLDRGGGRTRIWAKMVGGASMIGPATHFPGESIGVRNIRAGRQVLAELEIPLLAEDVGGTHGRTVVFDLHSGEIRVLSMHGSAKMTLL